MSDSLRVDTIMKRLQRYSRAEDIFGSIGIFIYLLKKKTHIIDYFYPWKNILSYEIWLRFFGDKGFTPILGLCVVAIYFISRKTAKDTLLMMTKLFYPDRMPQSINRLKGRNVIAGMVAAHLIVHLMLIFTIDNILIFCFILIVLFAHNLYNNHLQRNNLDTALNEFKIRGNNRNARYMKQRRLAVKNYIFNKSHTARESRVLIAGFVGLIFSSVSSLCSVSWGNTAAYIVVICALMLNEWTVFWWRRDLYIKFAEIQNMVDRSNQTRDNKRISRSRRND